VRQILDAVSATKEVVMRSSIACGLALSGVSAAAALPHQRPAKPCVVDLTLAVPVGK
jgi:hypothetical protein